MNQLTPEEERIIVEKGTERPFTGEYNDFHKVGTYLCKRCNAPLYRSTDKFDSGCGRPSFDDAVPGAVKWIPDPDGSRTEIECANCSAHLGHVFIGERTTEKNTRHCVNSLSMHFLPELLPEKNYETVTLGGGCFRCIEAVLQRLVGVEDIKSGFSGGKRPFPTYEQVSTGVSGHVEVVQIIFDPEKISFKQILEVFFSMHNPTTLNQQGNDIGEQYASVIFYHSELQKQISEELIKELNSQDIRGGNPIVTQLRPFEKFRVGEGYHQNFFNNNQSKPYCQLVINPKLSKLKEKWKSLLKSED